MAPELQTGRWSQPLKPSPRRFSLEVEVRSATQTEAIRLLEGSVTGTVFERGIDERESFLEAGSRLLVAVARRAIRPGRTAARRCPKKPSPSNGKSSWLRASHRLRPAHGAVAAHLADRQLPGHPGSGAGLGIPATTPGGTADCIRRALAEVRFDNMASRLRLWVDIIWLTRPLPGRRRYLDVMRQCFEAEPPRA